MAGIASQLINYGEMFRATMTKRRVSELAVKLTEIIEWPHPADT